MANDCFYQILAVGSKMALLELKRALTSNSWNEVHLYRIFEFYPDTFNGEEIAKCTNEYYKLSGYGTCAWSVYSCMLEGEHTYYDANHGDDIDDGPIDEYGTSLLKLTREAPLIVEVTSTKGGMGFAEHYIIADGEFIIDESRDFIEVSLEDTPLEEFIKITGVHMSEEDYEELRAEEDWYSMGEYSIDYDTDNLISKWKGVDSNELS